MIRFRNCLVGAALAVSVLPAATASAADSFSAAADPTTAGTAEKPAAEKITLDAQIQTDPTGAPHDAASAIAFALPAEFKDNLANFGVCPREKVHAAATGGPHDPPDCPANSKVGSGVQTSVIPALKLTSTSDRLYIYNTGNDTLTAWFHTPNPETTFTLDAALSQGSSPFGTIITWDFSAAANGTCSICHGIVVYVKHWQTVFETVPGTESGSASPTPTTTKKKHKVRLPCKRYRGRPHHRHCVAYRHGKKHHLPPRRSARAQAAQASMVSAFESTGCAGGSWPFQAKITFKKDPPSTIDQKVNCAPAGGTVQPGPAGPSPPSCPLPPPLSCPGSQGSTGMRAVRSGSTRD